jgi:hypothetical protein
MPRSWPRPEIARDLPYLTADNSRPTSKETKTYNCIAWAAGENYRNWWPDPLGVGYWPLGVPRELSIGAFVQAYETKGFRLCIGGTLEVGIEKVAIYGKRTIDGTIPTHAALQLPSGNWTSKLGRFEDIEHADIDAVNGPCYGSVVYYMSRSR